MGEGFRVSATHNSIVAGIEFPEKKIYAVQYHPEVNLTTNGKGNVTLFYYYDLYWVCDSLCLNWTVGFGLHGLER